jgi:hypothetical protein
MYESVKMLNSLMINDPIYSSVNEKILVVDSTNHIFKYNF